ncbi:hypothetical protein CKAN_02446000 [Cinnamomum micranthum f. kanehirae]|uniref:Uncharacterized protein n=1 Tax=Cinnamomum micranthum f. kanehirae TaxID=337451 RepID=A0A443PWL6_9MAGN|nr:hypothetical protein CKAN_02446000 [Cinnamomum micranthum f. kanehirae]
MAVTACYNAIDFKYIKAWKRIGGVEGRILSGKMCSDHKLAFGLLERHTLRESIDHSVGEAPPSIEITRCHPNYNPDA